MYNITKVPRKTSKDTWKEIVKPQQYHSKLNKLLDKISIQNRYSNRITLVNHHNIECLKNKQQQINALQQEKQYWESHNKRKFQLHQQNQSLRYENEQLKQCLNEMAIKLYKANKRIKQLSENIKEIQGDVVGLEIDNFLQKKKKIEEVCSIREQMENNQLKQAVKDFLMEAEFDEENKLVSYCRKCHLQNNYNQFFKRLNQQLIKWQEKDQQRMPICRRLRVSESKSKKRQQIGEKSQRTKKISTSFRHSRSKTLQSIQNARNQLSK